MITPRAIASLDKLLSRCLEESLKTQRWPVWHVESAGDPAESGPANFMMLTLSSYDFQLLVLLHFASNATTTGYVADALKLSAAELSLPQCHDYLAEVANNFCGAFKRDLGDYFPHLGMSTPNLLARENLRYLKDWSIGHATHLKAHSDDGVEFYGSLYVSAYGDMDFSLRDAPKTEQPADCGALELF
jgi:hypothetical protein